MDFIKLNLEPLALSIQQNADGWVKSIGHLLNESAKENLMSLKTELEVCIISFLMIKSIISLSL